MYLGNSSFCNSLEFRNLLKWHMSEIVRQKNVSLSLPQFEQGIPEGYSQFVMFHQCKGICWYLPELLRLKHMTEAHSDHSADEIIEWIRGALTSDGLQSLNSFAYETSSLSFFPQNRPDTIEDRASHSWLCICNEIGAARLIESGHRFQQANLSILYVIHPFDLNDSQPPVNMRGD